MAVNQGEEGQSMEQCPARAESEKNKAYQVIRKYEGEMAAEELVLRLIRAHMRAA